MASEPDRQFPSGFLWGSATSSHQVEGDNTGNDWWAWERQPGKIHDGSSSGRAAEWWFGRADEDLRRARELDQNAHRLSLEWSRLEPEPGRFDEAAFERYGEILRFARGVGLTTLVTLNHFTLPRWLSERGSWLADDAPERFEAYAGRVAERLGSEVDLFATLNEPNVLAFMAYAGRSWPPGHGSLRAGLRALANMLVGHARVYRALHALLPAANVGIVLSLPRFEPARERVRDRIASSLQEYAFSGGILNALESGMLLPPLSSLPRRVPGLAQAYDWLGVNYYGRYRVVFDPRAAPELFGRRLNEHSIRTATSDWGEPDADGLRKQLLALTRLRAPLYVTENGVMDAEDTLRQTYLRDHVRAVHAAIHAGADVRGYFHWSLIDNFEWAEGWSAPFGLLSLDRVTQERRPRPSAAYYASVCRSSSLTVEPSSGSAEGSPGVRRP